ncbi:MAG: BON domain-containing protein [Chthoniobacterales bacterium]
MKRLTLSLLSLVALALSAAAQESKTNSKTAADNTGRNERDRSGESKTSGDQSESSEDIKTTAAIRRAVVGDGSLSMTAKNVKIITANGIVTLRGPVNSAAEKSKIAELAKKNAGKAKIENQLDVKAAK